MYLSRRIKISASLAENHEEEMPGSWLRELSFSLSFSTVYIYKKKGSSILPLLSWAKLYIIPQQKGLLPSPQQLSMGAGGRLKRTLLFPFNISSFEPAGAPSASFLKTCAGALERNKWRY